MGWRIWRINKWHVRNIQIVNIAKKIIIVHAIIWGMEVLGIVIENCDYYICKANVFLYNEDWECVEESEFRYEIVFGYDERHWGYCKCSPGDKDYRKDKHCCGHGCDWDAPWIMVRKSFLISEHSWSGDEHDFWDFEDKFYESDNEENERKMKEEREYKIKNLKETIENAQKELEELENL